MVTTIPRRDFGTQTNLRCELPRMSNIASSQGRSARCRSAAGSASAAPGQARRLTLVNEATRRIRNRVEERRKLVEDKDGAAASPDRIPDKSF